MSVLGFVGKELEMPWSETKWWGNVLTGKIPFNDIYKTHNAMHANSTLELGNGWTQNHPDATAAAVIGSIFGGGALMGAGGAGGAGAGAGAAEMGAGAEAGAGGYGLTAAGSGGGLGGLASMGADSGAAAGGSTFADYGVSTAGLGGDAMQFGGPYQAAAGSSGGSGLFGMFNNLSPQQKAQMIQQGFGSMGTMAGGQRQNQQQLPPVDTSMPYSTMTPAPQQSWSWNYG
ncbi:hypothetical protein [Chromobacterium subtsugae]|uniref:hypothetical protein n=1 Tax=Chromobacterium subtsugae TaxID=251747 RepID=UPI0006411F89|nr:hypothetical protein [Chromobacterium subtsugae]